jgi:Family of unknown function (DUF5989)
MKDSSRQVLHRQAARPSLLAEYWSFVGHTGKWWLVPILLVTLALCLRVFLGGTGGGALNPHALLMP